MEAKAKATFDQAFQVLNLFHGQKPTCEEMQAIIASGIISDALEVVRTGNEINREAVRKALGLDYLLELVGKVAIPASLSEFIARDNFIVDTSGKAGPKIVRLGSNFEEWFLKKVEEPIDESELCYHRLLKSSRDGSIVAELGGKEKAETTLVALFALLEKQGGGEEGVLLVNEYANIFYIRDIKCVLRAVYVYWSDDGWYVNAHSVEAPFRWYAGYQVFFRNS